MTVITDEYMLEMLSRAREYTLVILRPGPKAGTKGAETIIMEHARNNFALRSEGKLSIVCPVNDGSDLAAAGIFNAGTDEVKNILENDPAIKAGIFYYEIHTCRSFPGDSLPNK